MTTTKSESSNMNTILSITTIGLGLVLLTYMITIESEPGAIPLLLILSGTIWLIATRIRNRKQNDAE